MTSPNIGLLDISPPNNLSTLKKSNMPKTHIRASVIMTLQDKYTSHWHNSPDLLWPESVFNRLVIEQHSQNFELWHEEDKARDPNALDTTIAHVKRNIDTLNQRRNDLVTELDVWLADNEFAQYKNENLPWNSETIGSIIDRLSIASLKVYHMAEQAERADASIAHGQNCEMKLVQLKTQQIDLVAAFQVFIEAIVSGQRQNKLYRQFKMYNDPNLNPKIYNKQN